MSELVVRYTVVAVVLAVEVPQVSAHIVRVLVGLAQSSGGPVVQHHWAVSALFGIAVFVLLLPRLMAGAIFALALALVVPQFDS